MERDPILDYASPPPIRWRPWQSNVTIWTTIFCGISLNTIAFMAGATKFYAYTGPGFATSLFFCGMLAWGVFGLGLFGKKFFFGSTIHWASVAAAMLIAAAGVCFNIWVLGLIMAAC